MKLGSRDAKRPDFCGGDLLTFRVFPLVETSVDGKTNEPPSENARKGATSYSAANQHSVILPWATHGVLQSGPKPRDGRLCSVALRAAFLLNPDAP